MERLNYHFEPKKGWINDPNGLIFYRGAYHIFFQHYPYAPRWGQMHWGHAVSRDLIHWEELPVALYPDQPYENSGGCFSGSAVEKDGMLYLFYTSVSHELGQTQSVAWSRDGVVFEKYRGNPVIPQPPEEGSADFRDPKVTRIGDMYYMVAATGKDGVGKIVLYRSEDLFSWEYQGVLLEGAEFGPILECPDFFPFADKYLLMFSQIERKMRSTMFVYGDFDGKRFTPISYHTPQIGPHYYAPQTFLDPKGRRIVIGWLRHRQEGDEAQGAYDGALTIPCTLEWREEKLLMYPAEECRPLLCDTDARVEAGERQVVVKTEGTTVSASLDGRIRDVKILRDTKTIEVFVNGGEAAFTCWVGAATDFLGI